MEKVRLVPNERLDIKDVTALQALVYEHVQQALGGLMGFGSGTLSPFLASPHNDGTTWWHTFSPFVFYRVDETKTRNALDLEHGGGSISVGTAWDGQVVTYDPNVEDTHADYTSARLAARTYVDDIGGAIPEGIDALPYLWARPYLTAADEDTRRVWSLDAALEVPVTMATRERLRVEFRYSDTQPDADDDRGSWARIAKITAWINGLDGLPDLPTIQAISVWDNPENHQQVGESATWYTPGNHSGLAQQIVSEVTGLQAGGGITWPSKHRDLGLIKLLRLIRNRLHRFAWLGNEDPDGTTRGPWFGLPKYSLSGLAKLYDTLNIFVQQYSVITDGALASLTSRTAALEGVRRAWATSAVASVDGDGVPSGVTWAGSGVASMVPHVQVDGGGAATASYYVVQFTDTAMGGLSLADQRLTVRVSPKQNDGAMGLPNGPRCFNAVRYDARTVFVHCYIYDFGAETWRPWLFPLTVELIGPSQAMAAVSVVS